MALLHHESSPSGDQRGEVRPTRIHVVRCLITGFLPGSLLWFPSFALRSWCLSSWSVQVYFLVSRATASQLAAELQSTHEILGSADGSWISGGADRQSWCEVGGWTPGRLLEIELYDLSNLWMHLNCPSDFFKARLKIGTLGGERAGGIQRG